MDLFEILIILAVALIVIPPERLPELIRAAAKIVRELRTASNTVMRELSDALEDEPAPRDPRASGGDPPAKT